MIDLRLEYVKKFINEEKYAKIQSELQQVEINIAENKYEHESYLGWLQEQDSTDLIAEIESCAKECRELGAEVLVVIGVGGSYLGARAIDEALSSQFKNPYELEIIYAGLNLSGSYLHDLLAYIKNKNVVVNVISKSGSTVETAVAFRVIQKFMHDTYKETACERIFVTTDRERGSLKQLARENNYQTFVIPADIGGRFSVLTATGLLPLAIAGHDITAILAGEAAAKRDFLSDDTPVVTYASLRKYFHDEGYDIELLASFEPALKYLHEWWKQLFGESEGKSGQGLFPAAVSYTTDLHSLGQYVQDGKRILFETLIHFENINKDVSVPKTDTDIEKINYLTDKTFNEMNALSVTGTMKAHYAGNVPVIQLVLPTLDAYHLGYLIHFFMRACMLSAYLLEINPFDQPGVEAYKKETAYLFKQ